MPLLQSEESMVPITETRQTTIHAACQAVLRSLDAQLDDNGVHDPLENLAEVAALLETLPLATEESGLAHNRLRNARRYYQAREAGAARFELRLLASSLRHRFADQHPVEPRPLRRKVPLG
jgi:hypothetical protein